MGSKIRAILLVVIAACVGYALGVLLPVPIHKRVNADWRALEFAGKNFGLSFATDVVFSDLPLADVTNVSGKAKFIDAVDMPNESTEFGYLIDVTMAAADISKMPAQYRKQNASEINGKRLISPPVDQISYAIEFGFTLKDKDGFVLAKLKSGDETIESGRTSEFQGKPAERVPYSVAVKTVSILVSPSLVKCHTCNSR